MEVPMLLVMGIFVAILVLAGVFYSISEFTSMKDPREKKNNGKN